MILLKKDKKKKIKLMTFFKIRKKYPWKNRINILFTFFNHSSIYTNNHYIYITTTLSICQQKKEVQRTS